MRMFWKWCFWLTSLGTIFSEFFRLARYLKLLMRCQAFTVGNRYQACQRKLIRNALLFTALQILVKVPAGAFVFLIRLPPHMVNPAFESAIKDWRRFVFGVATVAAGVYPFIVFVFSLEIRKYFCKCGRPSAYGCRQCDPAISWGSCVF